jgi:hypothetical protein
MVFGDRMALTIKEFGRRVVITVNRGKVKVSANKKKITITYLDDENRGKKIRKSK